jgi:hypothetical protein
LVKDEHVHPLATHGFLVIELGSRAASMILYVIFMLFFYDYFDRLEDLIYVCRAVLNLWKVPHKSALNLNERL